MIRRTFAAPVLYVLLLLPAVVLRADGASKWDKDLDGNWSPVSTVADGKEQPAPHLDVEVTIRDGVMTGRLKDMKNTMKLKTDAAKTPRTVDLIPDDGPDKGKTALGVYEIKGDELRICFTKPGNDRPTEVSSKAGSGAILMTLKRVKK